MPPLTSAILRPLRSPPYSFLCPKNLTSAKPLHFHCNTTPRSDPIFSASTSPLPSLRCRCAAKSDGTGPSAEDMVSDMVEKLLRREENKELLDGLEEASARVERAREALADIERQEADALRAKEYVRQLQFREAVIAESQRELLEARTKVEEAQQSLSANMVENYNKVVSSEAIDRHKERLESGKAALVSSLAGSLASVPISLYQATSFPQLILHLVVISFSCALFGVTFRYTVRRDLDNFQLKTGTCAAFGFIKGLSAAEVGKTLELDTKSLTSFSIDGAVSVSENIFIFLTAAIALDFCFKMGILSPFPIRK
ncbi:hypothetical protein Cni_G21891 [Canna indica]|uniref:Uncharacterized protein n=1 Tax=Canna indica TaxID=4628 RepID=A0AAQ3KQD9_9LILI|nr:hypothetical protein Cni_G21891 [Canna indica]